MYQDYSRKNKEFMEEIVWIPETEENIVWIPDYSLQILPPSRLRRSTNNNYINGFI
jgi:trehalose-6-phosphate synthase